MIDNETARAKVTSLSRELADKMIAEVRREPRRSQPFEIGRMTTVNVEGRNCMAVLTLKVELL